MTVILIVFGTDLPTENQNKLRAKMHLASWKAKWRKAEEEKDSEAMDRLDAQYEMVGLP